MKSYVVVYDANGNELENFITHYKTLSGFVKYGVKNWIRNKKAVSFTFATFGNSADLYADNFQSVQEYTL